jgi:regulator of protease activity HflC (stomatin/prohibitin superfamily)
MRFTELLPFCKNDVPIVFLFIFCEFVVQYRVIDDKVPSAYYKLTDPQSQIRSYVFDVIRSSLPRLDLDDAFASKDEVAKAVKAQLSHLMVYYSYKSLIYFCSS